MAQQTFNNGDQRADIRTKLNANATENESRNTTNVANIATNASDITALQDVNPESIVVVKEAADLSGTLLSTKVYVIDGAIDMGTQQITRPTGGLSIRGAGSVTDSLFSTENAYTMFTDANDAGHFIASGISFTTSGTTSKVFDIESSGTTDIFSIDRCAFVSCTEIGTVKGYGICLVDSTQDALCGTGYTFDGSIILLKMVGNASTGMVTGGTNIISGATLSITNNCVIEAGTYVIGTGATLCDFAAGDIVNDAGFEVIINNISGAGTFFSNLNGSDVKCRWRDNNFDPASAESNTYVGAFWEITAEVATVIGAPATDVKVAGVTTYAEEFWFSSTVDNAFVYDSTRSVKVEIKGAVAITGTNGHDIQLKVRKWDDSATAYVDIQTVPAREMSSTGAAASVAILAYTTIDDANDRIELWGQNVGNTANFTVKDNSVFAITERAN